MPSAATNLLVYAADPKPPFQDEAERVFNEIAGSREEVVLCELVLIQVCMQLSNPAIFPKPQSPKEAADYCARPGDDTGWRHTDCEPAVSPRLWKWAASAKSGFRDIIDARLALTLRRHGVTRFATANVKHFQDFGFTGVWNPLVP